MTTSLDMMAPSGNSDVAATGIVARGLVKSFDATEVLRGVDFAGDPGTMLALLGRNGAGKTTIVRILTTLLRPDAGTATVGGYDVVTRPDSVRGVIGLTGQDTSVDGLLTGRENLVMIGRLFGLRTDTARRRAGELLERFDLDDAADRAVKTYSGGMRRRLDLATSLVAVPSIMFLDEPTTGLDPMARQKVWAVIRDLMNAGTTVLLTTQYLEEADRLADRIAVIDQGQLIAEGTPAVLKRQVGSERAELTFTDRADFDSARSLITGPGLVAVEAKSMLSMPIDDPWQLHAVLGRLRLAGVKPINLTVAEPTLDDVFFSVTGAHQPVAIQEAS